MIVIDKDKLEQAILNIMDDHAINGFSSLAVCIGEVEGVQVQIKVTSEERMFFYKASNPDECITDTEVNN